MLLNNFMTIISKIPYFKGKGRIFNIFKNLYLKCNRPIVWVDGELGNLKIDLRSFEWVYFCNKAYDKNLMTKAFKYIDINKDCIDVGAHIGFWSLGMARYIKKNNGTGRVIAIEPHPENFARLQENILANKLDDVVLPFNVALSDKENLLELVLRQDFKNGASTGNASIAIGNNYDKLFQKITIKAYNGDNFLNSVGIADIGFIKADIEGHEDFFFRGITNLLETYQPYILTEINLPFYRARGVHDIIGVFNKIFHDWTFMKDGHRSRDLTYLVKTDVSNIFIEPPRISSHIHK